MDFHYSGEEMNISRDWYDEPLRVDDIIAGLILFAFGFFFICLYSVVSFVMKSNDKEIVGFRFLFSASIADIILLFNYTIWPSITILFKSEIIEPWMRHWVQLYLDWIWFSMCWHYVLIAWSRFAAIRHPNMFRIQKRSLSYSLCGFCFLSAFLQVLCTHFQPWYVTFYYEPSHYGMLSEDFEKYLNSGQSLFFATFHFLMIIVPAFFYGSALFLLLRHRRSGATLVRKSSVMAKPSSVQSSRTEARLIIPCICNSVVFIIGQIVITMGTGEGKWATWMVMFLFSANSAVNPLLLLAFSAIIREKTLSLICGLRRKGSPTPTEYSGANVNSQQSQFVGIQTTVRSDSEGSQLIESRVVDIQIILDQIANGKFQTFV